MRSYHGAASFHIVVLVILFFGIKPALPQGPTVITRPPNSEKKSPRLSQLAYALHKSSLDLPGDARRQVEYATLSIVLLSDFNRLLPAGIPPQELDALSKVFLTSSPDVAEQARIASSLPPADSL